MNHIVFIQNFTGTISERETIQLRLQDNFFTFPGENKIEPNRLLNNNRTVSKNLS